MQATHSASFLKQEMLTFSVGAGILAMAGMGGVMPPLSALLDVLAVVTDRRRRGIRALTRVDAILFQCIIDSQSTVKERIDRRLNPIGKGLYQMSLMGVSVVVVMM